MGQLIHTEGIVLRAVPFQDHDLILTVLTDSLGKVALFAKGARRPKSRFGPEIDLLSHSEFVLLNSKNIKPLREANIKTYFHDLKGNYDHLTSALQGARLVSHFVKEDQKDTKTLKLYFALLNILNQKDVVFELYDLAFKLRLLDNFGIAPHLANCIRCGRDAASWRFSVERGGLVCPDCQHQSDMVLKAGMAQSLQALRTMDWEKLARLKLQARELVIGNKLLDRFMAYHVQDAPLKSLQ